MSIFDKIKNAAKDATGIGLSAVMNAAKDATGIGLSADEQYKRAYEKGVFLKPADYQTAVKWFNESAEQFTKNGNPEMAKRARANAAIYNLIQGKDLGLVASTLEAVRNLDEIERVGTQTEMLPAAVFVDELSGLSCEHQASSSDDLAAKVALYKSASDSFLKVRNQEPQFVFRFDVEGPTDSFTKRGFYCLALSEFHAAKSLLLEFPTQALDNLHKSVTLYKQSQSQDDEQRVQGFINDIQLKRHCWCCGREMQGKGLFYKYYPAKLEKYHRHLIVELKQDDGMVEQDGHVTLCTICGSAMEIQADQYATMRSGEVRDWAKEIFDSHADAINRLNDAVRELGDRISRISSSR